MTDNATECPDLYDVLGVHRDASQLAIRQAYREKAKVLHPDVVDTGNKLEFAQIRLARDVLLNPKSRANYDAVGAIDMDQAENDVAEILTALTGIFGSTMHSLLSNGHDCTRGDFVAAMQQAVKLGFEQANKQISQLEQSLEQVRRLVGRFKVRNLEHPNHMATIVDGQVAQLVAQIQQQRAALRQMERARIVLNDVLFERET